MQPYQWANSIVATVCALVFLIVARRTRDKITKGAMAVWAFSMFWAAVSGPLIVLTDYDAHVQLIGRIVTPLGWTALTLCALRRLVA